jgi:nitric oxide reductase NorD protein
MFCLSRQVGGLLGNDLGQMRVQFNARTYVVEPVYRDDGLGLWDFGDRAQPQDEVVEMMVEAARLDRRDDADNPDRRREEAEPTPDAVGRARERAPDERGPVLATYPEWDCDAGTERPDWTTVRAAPIWPVMPARSTPHSTRFRPCVRASAVLCAAPRSAATSA